jgi:ADP-heptose:LPS heptosyltransferase
MQSNKCIFEIIYDSRLKKLALKNWKKLWQKMKKKEIEIMTVAIFYIM